LRFNGVANIGECLKPLNVDGLRSQLADSISTVFNPSNRFVDFKEHILLRAELVQGKLAIKGICALIGKRGVALGLAEIVPVLVEIADEAIARAATQVAAALIPFTVPDEGGRPLDR